MLLSSTFRRSTVGLDRLFDLLENSSTGPAQDNYPPFDLIRHDDNRIRVSIAVAGFTQNGADITPQQNELIVRSQKTDDHGASHIQRGSAAQDFRLAEGLGEYQVWNRSVC